MQKYEYKFINVPAKNGLKVKCGETFEECKNIINSSANEGWRLKQIVMPFNEKTGIYTTYCYEIILEREI